MARYNKYWVLFIFLMGSLCACGPKPEKAEQILLLDESAFVVADWSEIFHIEEIVCLKDNEDSLFSVAQKCLLNNERILFWDAMMKCVYVHDRNGNFLFTVGRRGGADFECADLRDVFLGTDCYGQIELLDATGILAFDAKEGRFLGKRKLGLSSFADYFKFLPLSDTHYLFFAPAGDFSVYEWNAGELRGLRERKGYQLSTEHFCRDGENVLVNADYGHFVIDTYHNGRLTHKYCLDFHGEEISENLLPENSMQFRQADGLEDYFKSIVDVKGSNDWLYARVVGPSQSYYDIFFDKGSRRIWAGPSDKDLGLSMVAVEGKYFYGLIYPEYISKDDKLYAEVANYFEDGIDSNPLLVKFTINAE